VAKRSQHTQSFVTILFRWFLKLSEDAQQLRKDNEYPEYHLNKTATNAPTISTCHEIILQGVKYFSLRRSAPEPAICSASTGADARPKSYKDVLSTGLKPQVSGLHSGGSTTVSNKKKPASGTPLVNTVKQRGQPLTGAQNTHCTKKRKKGKSLRTFSLSLQSCGHGC
jgi:hypothetical protein